MVRYLAPIARCRILAGDKEQEFLTGDRLLRSVKVILSEDQRASTCSFEVFDPELLLANDFFEISFSQGGIQVPPDLLEDPNAAKTQGSGVTPSAGSSVNYAALPEGLRSAFEGGSNSLIARAVGHSEGNRTASGGYTESYNGHIDPGNGASNIGSFSYQTQQGGASTPEAADELWLGRLQQQMPAYQAAAQAGGLDPNDPRLLANFADLYTQSPLAATGTGGFLDRLKSANGDASYSKIQQMRLDSYRNPSTGNLDAPGFGNSMSRLQTDQERRMQALETVLQGSNLSTPSTPPTTPKQETPADQAKTAAAAQPAIADAAKSKPTEVSNKGTEIIVELGYQIDQLIAFHFIHVGTRANRLPDTCAFDGQSIRWLMTRRTKNTAFENLTLRELAEQVAASYGFELDMEGDGPTYQHLDQTGITDYELLLREARAIGYSIREENNKLILKPYRPNFTGFVITQDILISITFTDKASKDRQGVKTSEPDKSAADSKAKIDRLSGQATQTKEEDSTAAAVQNNGIVQLFDLAFGEDQKAVNDTVAMLTGADKKPVGGTPAPESAKKIEGQSTDDPVTGLPKQEIGAIDLADGKAEAQVIKDEKRRVKGYESTATVLTTPEVLTIAPGSVIGISRNIVPEVFAREWRVYQITHEINQGRFTSTIEFYSPQAAKAGSGSGSVTSDPTSSINNATTSEGWAWPMKLEGNSSCGSECEFGYSASRGRLHEGVDIGGFGTGSDPDGVFAACDGTVTYADWMGGYGRTVDVKRTDGWVSRCAHLAKIDVSIGDTVKQGQRIGTRGGSGYGKDNAYQIHVHTECRRPDGQAVDPRTVLPKPGLQIAG